MSILKQILEKRCSLKEQLPCCSDCGMQMKMRQGSCPGCGAGYGLSMGAKDSPGMSEEKTEEPTTDFKLDKLGRKIKASKIVFNTGEDDTTKKVQESMKLTYKDFVDNIITIEEARQIEDEINEVLSKDASAGKWISDFVHSDNPKFAGKSKEKRKQMALAAYYAKQRNEEAEIEEELKGNQHKLDKNKNGKLDAEDFKKLRKEQLSEREDREDDEGYHRTRDEDEAWNRQIEAKKRAAAAAKKNAAPKKTNEELDEVFTYKQTLHHIRVDATSGTDKDKLGKVGKFGEKSDLSNDEHYKKAMEDAHAYGKSQFGGKYTVTHMDPRNHSIRAGSVTKVRRQMNEDVEIDEAWSDMVAAGKKRAETEKKTSTMTAHDVKKTSTGTVYTKQRDAEGMNKEFKRDTAEAKRGRGRPKKDKFAEAVEVLLNLSEEQFDSMVEDGFDAFFEAFEQLDELSKSTLGSYAKKASADAASSSSSHMAYGSAGLRAHLDGDKKNAADWKKSADQFAKRAQKRRAGVNTAVDRLTK